MGAVVTLAICAASVIGLVVLVGLVWMLVVLYEPRPPHVCVDEACAFACWNYYLDGQH